VICDICGGTGHVRAPGGAKQCPFCKGTGTSAWRDKVENRMSLRAIFGPWIGLAIWLGVTVPSFMPLGTSWDWLGWIAILLTFTLLPWSIIRLFRQAKLLRRGSLTGAGEIAAIAGIGLWSLRRSSRHHSPRPTAASPSWGPAPGNPLWKG
jgi:hypothetical protein